MKIFYFTATGNNLYIAKSIGGELHSIPKIMKGENFEFTDEKIGVVFPIYAITVPPYIEEFLKKSTFNCEYLFAVMSYGIFNGAATDHLCSIAKEADLNFSYINTVKMVDNWLPGFNMQKQIDTEHKKQIEKQLEVVKSDIANSKEFIPTSSMIGKIATNRTLNEAKKASKETLHGNIIGAGIKNFMTVEDKCTQCGVCTRVCPVDNIEIDKENGKIALNNKCISCFACVHHCPSKAIHLKGERSNVRFRNRNIELKEIIESNN
ncbi:hypothetical protein AN639_11075 [Candidatus Epulonipiscium fishelsonii]|uniref:Uncharacterized protein n=1 Tax=Candidatus Epulonipiscium fishelsonii TaxID=77094 RepID=A0ACC8XCM9_9FIRM|nr:hypothetical protein AN396_05900 [Epulopiscium sp. SCG-B11WGA-EpuloA1]ONI43214.1 hypothetical protein AN639_11075 [Epulopiscium sp. SCG-B05WGA-EpuloA1]